MRKYHVVDADGSEYNVEELDEELVEEEKFEDDDPAFNALSSEEIEALKRLAGVADKLLAMLETHDSDMDEDNLIQKDEDEEEIEDEDEEREEVIDTDEEEEEKKPTHDSKKSFGSLESKKKTSVEDNSLIDEISDAWSKRFGGNK